MADTCISSTWTTGTFQLPLSGSRNMLKEEYKLLSTIKLSTPSLGITFAARFAELAIRIWNFQLPLSGSRGDEPERICSNSYRLSTPSLGITCSDRGRDSRARESALSTPSLGITCGSRGHEVSGMGHLSTPSLGITWEPYADDWTNLVINFQLPLSGSRSDQ